MGGVTTFTPPQAFISGGAASRISGAPTLLDVTLTLAGAAATGLWAATRNHATGGDLGWATFLTLLGVVTAVEGHGELHDIGVGAAGAGVSYLAVRFAGGMKQPTVLAVGVAATRPTAARIQVRARGFLAA